MRDSLVKSEKFCFIPYKGGKVVKCDKPHLAPQDASSLINVGAKAISRLQEEGDRRNPTYNRTTSPYRGGIKKCSF